MPGLRPRLALPAPIARQPLRRLLARPAERTPKNSAARVRARAAAPTSAGEDSYHGDFDAAREHQGEDVGDLRAQRHPDAEFALRWLTQNASTPKMPTAESSNASAAKPPTRRARNLGRATDSAAISSMVRMLVTASCLSNLAITPLTAAVKASGSPAARTAMDALSHAFWSIGHVDFDGIFRLAETIHLHLPDHADDFALDETGSGGIHGIHADVRADGRVGR